MREESLADGDTRPRPCFIGEKVDKRLRCSGARCSERDLLVLRLRKAPVFSARDVAIGSGERGSGWRDASRRAARSRMRMLLQRSPAAHVYFAACVPRRPLELFGVPQLEHTWSPVLADASTGTSTFEHFQRFFASARDACGVDDQPRTPAPSAERDVDIPCPAQSMISYRGPPPVRRSCARLRTIGPRQLIGVSSIISRSNRRIPFGPSDGVLAFVGSACRYG